MNILLRFTCWILVLTLHVIACSLIDRPKQNRIHGGEPCNAEGYEDIVSFRDMLGHRCGGSLIDEYLVLTAAHCGPIARTATAFAGLGGTEEHIQKSKIDEAILHPSYNENTDDNDIAIFILKDPIKETEYVKFTSIPQNVCDKNICDVADVKGWGETESTRRPNELMCVKLKVINSSYCQDLWGKEKLSHPEDVICTLSDDRKDACFGDSGGPIICDGVQVGVTSWGGECGHPKEPGVFARIDSYLDFIRETMEYIKAKKTTEKTTTADITVISTEAVRRASSTATLWISGKYLLKMILLLYIIL